MQHHARPDPPIPAQSFRLTHRPARGRNATTHWSHHTFLERLGATYRARRWVEDGKVITSAGVLAGIDMALHLVERLTDEGTARMVQLGIEYDPKPRTAASSGAA